MSNTDNTWINLKKNAYSENRLKTGAGAIHFLVRFGVVLSCLWYPRFDTFRCSVVLLVVSTFWYVSVFRCLACGIHVLIRFGVPLSCLWYPRFDTFRCSVVLLVVSTFWYVSVFRCLACGIHVLIRFGVPLSYSVLCISDITQYGAIKSDDDLL